MQKSTIRTQQLYNRENNKHEIVKAKEIKMEKLAHEEKADTKWILLPLFLVWIISSRFFTVQLWETELKQNIYNLKCF